MYRKNAYAFLFTSLSGSLIGRSTPPSTLETSSTRQEKRRDSRPAQEMKGPRRQTSFREKSRYLTRLPNAAKTSSRSTMKNSVLLEQRLTDRPPGETTGKTRRSRKRSGVGRFPSVSRSALKTSRSFLISSVVAPPDATPRSSSCTMVRVTRETPRTCVNSVSNSAYCLSIAIFPSMLVVLDHRHCDGLYQPEDAPRSTYTRENSSKASLVVHRAVSLRQS